MRKIKTKIKNLNINYIKKGKGEVVLILPGWGTTINVYNTLIESISSYSQVYCLDMPGFGESEEPSNGWNTDDFVNFIIEFIEKEKIEKLSLIGHSNGGRIIIKLLNRKKLKFKIDKVILIGSAGILHKKTIKQKAKVKSFKIGKKILKCKNCKNIISKSIRKFPK